MEGGKNNIHKINGLMNRASIYQFASRMWNCLCKWCRRYFFTGNCSSYEKQNDENSDLRALITKASVSETSRDIGPEKSTDEYDQKDQYSFSSLFEQHTTKLSDKLAEVSAERDVLLEQINLLKKSIDWLSTENEGQKQEIERLHDAKEVADALRIKYEAITRILNKLRIENSRLKVSLRDKSRVSAENVLAMCSEMAKLSAERDASKTSYEAIAEENSRLKRQSLETLEADGVESE
ncbi:unconventional myosin-XVIIIa-like [Zootermopsis nevadensis]|uniref:Uncharacterized protein n=1 Tax=Zootermopsis nevadensis TaxID=136037 RepID=A0A067QU09_ZOONE|nr:unconventional myosin-XVIIIa-like [Zootermopsis nevadensis]KDR13320.1 hypothetical protein L798_12945 [Zootermopsis nevadensis]